MVGTPSATLVIPASRREEITFGVGADNARFHTVADNFVTPFARSWEHVSAWLKGLGGAGRTRAAH